MTAENEKSLENDNEEETKAKEQIEVEKEQIRKSLENDNEGKETKARGQIEGFFKDIVNPVILEKLKDLNAIYPLFYVKNPEGYVKVHEKTLKCYTLCLDIRKSSDLMSVCESIQFYPLFLSNLITELSKVIKKHNAVYDKFTGDGILCHFIEEINEDAHLDCMKCSIELHNMFREMYSQHRRYFKLELADTGIGVGIDYGEIFFKVINKQLFVIGESVNYSCRLSSAPAYKTYFNTTAFHSITHKNKSKIDCSFTRKEINIKGKGNIYIYELDYAINRIFEIKSPAQVTKKTQDQGINATKE